MGDTSIAGARGKNFRAVSATVAAAGLWALLAVGAWASEAVTFDLSSAYSVDLLGTVAERAACEEVYHVINPDTDCSLHDVFGDHWKPSGVYDCYYVHDTYGLPTSGRVQTSYGPYQLGPAAVSDPSTYQRSPNAAAFGKPFGSDRVVVTVTLPPGQRGRYSDVNFMLAHWYAIERNGASADRCIRIWADYETGPAALLYEGPILAWNVAEDQTFVAAHVSSRYMGACGSPREPTVRTGSRMVWEFRQPRELDSARTLAGFRFEGTEVEADAEDFAVVFAATGHRLEAADLPIAIELTKDFQWCYQNTPATTLDRHKVTLTVSIVPPDPNDNSSYSTQVRQTGGPGAVTLRSTADPLVWHLVGGRRGETAAGLVQLEVVVTGNEHGGRGQATDLLTVRLFGDIDGNGFVSGSDKLLLNKRLNGLSTPCSERDFDLNGDGEVSGIDKLQLNRILNGLPVP